MATGFNVNTFRNAGLRFGGARSTLFNIVMSIPPAVGAEAGTDDKFRYTCRASTLPPATIGTVTVPYFGRGVKFSGDRVFGDWSVTVMNDEDFLVRSMFEKWSNSLNALESNIRSGAYGNDLQYKSELNVNQFSKTGELIRQITIVGAFPVTVGEIQLDWDNRDQVETFGVTFAYDYWLPTVENSNPYLPFATSPV